MLWSDTRGRDTLFFARKTLRFSNYLSKYPTRLSNLINFFFYLLRLVSHHLNNNLGARVPKD